MTRFPAGLYRFAVPMGMAAAASGSAATILVTSANIKNGTIQTVDISAGAKRALKGQRGPRGLQGTPGAQGIQGPPGAPGAQGSPGIQSLTRIVASIDVDPETFDSVTADCPAGQKAVSGGVAFPGGGAEIWESQQKPIGGAGWSVTGANFNTTETFTLYAIALCSPNVIIN